MVNSNEMDKWIYEISYQIVSIKIDNYDNITSKFVVSLFD